MALISPVSSPNGKIFNQKLYARIRVATESDVPHIYKLMQQLFVYHNIIHLLKSTQSSIASGLFKPKFTNISPVTTLLVEVSANPFPSCPTGNVKEVELNLPLVDKESEQFRVIKDDHDDVFIAGFVMFYPCFSSFFEKPVFHMENFFLRECYKRKGFGKWLFSTMASEAARMGLSSVNWDASDWDESALEFYKQMGATISGGLRNLSLAGNALEAFDDDSN
ncbi:probable acetyltransferase NATA1-like [Capsicum annuum]|uniref:probable acetyltransferase NATA1-like n=1 Tax=Capsicum annuum TaxID=4072 RepID=UPI001FB12C66|nr:probable acetyltransferase NATA1-like [Capsicum annuum]